MVEWCRQYICIIKIFIQHYQFDLKFISWKTFSGYGNGFDTHETFSLSDSKVFGKNVIIFWVDDSSSVQTDNSNKKRH